MNIGYKLAKLITSVISTFLLVLLTTVSSSALEISDINEPKVVEAFVDGFVIPLMEIDHSASGVVSIVKDGKLVFSKGYGHQDIENNIPVDPAQTLFRPGSISKLFTWISVMQMVEQGKLDLDTDINKYLKTFQIKNSYPNQPITMRHIMTHTTGFEDGGLGYFEVNGNQNIIPLAESMKKHQLDRVNPPGVQTAYSNYATALAGLIVANVSGVDFNDYIQTNIFDVLGMKSSSFYEPLPDKLLKNMAKSYAFERGQFVAKHFQIIANLGPAGASSSTATDMAIFAQTILNGGEYNGKRILQQQTMQQMLTREFSHDDRLMGMGLGFYETEYNGVRLVGHAGATDYFRSDFGVDQTNNLAFFASFTGGTSMANKLAPALYNAFNTATIKPTAPPANFNDYANKYAGNYFYWRSNFSTFEKLLTLLNGEMSVTPTPNNTLLFAGGRVSGEYVEIESNLFREINGLKKIAFQEDSLGNVKGFVADGMPFMSTFKAPIYFTSSFNIGLLILSLFLFIGVTLKVAYRWKAHRALEGLEGKVTWAAIISSYAHLLTVVVGVIAFAIGGASLAYEIPSVIVAWLWLPIISTILSFYLLYNAVIVFKNGLLDGKWARARYTLVTVASLFMCWFYYFWNILGFNYLT